VNAGRRRATFTYTAAGQLASIADVVGLTSSFGYGPDDFVTTLTTPYGTTSFRHEPNWYLLTVRRFIEATCPTACDLRHAAGGLVCVLHPRGYAERPAEAGRLSAGGGPGAARRR